MTVAVLAAAASLSAERTFILNGTAASVGKTLITVQDAYFYRALMRFRDGEGDPLELEKGEALRKTVQKMAFEEMVFQELMIFQFDAGPRKQAVDMIQKRKGKGKDKLWREILKSFGRMEEAAVDRLYRSIQVEKFLQRKVETLTPIITLKELEEYFAQHQERFKGNTFEALKPSIEVLLKKERMRKALEEWIRFLRDKYGVTNHLTTG